MSCTPYDPAAGLFITNLGWGTQSPSPWRFAKKEGSSDKYQLMKSGAVVKELTIPSASVVRWIFFPKTKNHFLAVRNIRSGQCDMWIFDLRGSTINYRKVPVLLSLPDDGSLEFQHSQDGKAFFVFVGHGSNETDQHYVLRSDSADVLCNYSGKVVEVAQRHAEVTASRTVRIMTYPGQNGPKIHEECKLPSGFCKIPECIFEEVVVDGPEVKRISRKSIRIRNTGSDCLKIERITDINPFKVSDSITVPISISSKKHFDIF